MAELDSQPKSIQSLYAWYGENKLWVNRRYQRKLVWTLEEKQKLVESVLKRYPIPAILLAEREGGDYEVIDGLQRLHTIMSFIETAFPTLDGKYFDVSQFVTAKTRSVEEESFSVSAGEVISAREVGTILDYTIAVSVMRGATDEEIDDVFSRINTYGHRLSDQERRQAGVRDGLSTLVRRVSCEVRGDSSSDILGLDKMPAISIDLPKTKHGYKVEADTVFWVEQGILTATDLRDSMDEQCIADIAASIIGGTLIERSKVALDSLYEKGTPENERIIEALDSYGADRFAAEFKYCLDEIRNVCGRGGGRKLRSIIFSKTTTNPFPAVFAVLCVAFHELFFIENKKIADYDGLQKALVDLDKRIVTGKSSTSVTERRKNVETIKGLIRTHMVASEHRDIYGEHTATDVDNAIRRSQIEAPHYELKQGLLRLDNSRSIDADVLNRVIKTICAIANNGKGRAGTILIGVADKESDAKRVRDLDNVTPRMVCEGRFVVGVRREASVLKESEERYFGRWKTGIRASGLPQGLKDAVLSSIAYSSYYGLGVIIIRVPEQTGVSLLDGKIYIREGDETIEVETIDVARTLEIGKRFQ
ncbi:GmrSD restriction endonuclease domain-containing protein [Streptomyces amritsarensis]|uniref:GmrSD restriction endonuclease domain-containing protein n=1 Tax=Streptomyces amritsarensis TaxID=681158 RepID=UPI0036CCD533